MHGIADLDFGVSDFTGRAFHAHPFFGAECFLIEFDRLGGIVYG